MRKIVGDKQELTLPQQLKHDIISQFSCAEIRLQVIWQCTSTTFLRCYHPVSYHGTPTQPPSPWSRVALWTQQTPVQKGCVGHPDRATPPGSQHRQQGHACCLMVLESPCTAVEHQILSSLQHPWWQCSGKLSQKIFELASPPPSPPLPLCYNSTYFQVKHQTGCAQTNAPRAQAAGLCHPMCPGFPQLGELQVPSCTRETPQLNPSPLPSSERRVPQHIPPDTSC